MYLQLAAFVALSAGRMAEAAAAYGDLVEVLSEVSFVEPLSFRFEPDWIEACVGAGDLAMADRVAVRLAQRHERIPRPWTRLGIARSRVLLAGAAGGDVDGALAELVAALDELPTHVLPLDRARCLLVAGVAHRRARRKAEARSALETAHAQFVSLGAAAFAARTESELARLGVRAVTEDALTPTESRVARLAAQGHTNRAIADVLFISSKTVEANLVRIYRKLGVANRAQLATAMAREPH